MAVEQHYSLRWNDYTVKIVTAFQSLRDEEDFVDVTVACDGHHYSAHKMVLSACSPYFRSLLKANPCQHPIVILKDVGHLEMERLLEFMYNGEVNIAQDQLAAFLKTAESLKIRGLAGSSDDSDQSQQSQKDLAHAYTACLQQGTISDHSNTSNFSGCKEDIMNDAVFNSSPPTKRRKRAFESIQDTSLHSGTLGETNLIEDRVESADNGGIDLDDDPRSELKSEPNEHLAEVYTDNAELNADGQHLEAIDQRSIVYSMSTMPGTSGSQISNQDSVGSNSQDNGGINEADASSSVSTFGFPWSNSSRTADNQCMVCLKSFSNRGSMTRHLRDQHLQPGATVTCDICGKVCKNRNCLITHRSVAHNNRKKHRNQVHAIQEVPNSTDPLNTLFQLQETATSQL